MLLKAVKRGTDAMGSGEFGASRGSRTHVGIDYCAEPGQVVCSPVDGTVTKLGYPYGDDLSYRYVEITCDLQNLKHRLFYVSPSVKIGERIDATEPVGTAQNIAARYKDRGQMKNHVHYEVKKGKEFLNPEEL